MHSIAPGILNAFSAPLVLLAAVMIFGVGFVVLKPLVLDFIRLKVGREKNAPLPVAWTKLLQEHLPLFRRLSNADQTRLLVTARDLMMTTRWEGCGGLTLTSDMQLLISAQAALMALNLPADAYADLREILVYPGTMRPQRTTPSRDPFAPTRPGEPILGEAWKSGTVVISWDAALSGAADPDDGHNTVLHEFAHILDFRAGLTAATEPHKYGTFAPSKPPGHVLTDREAWHELIGETYTRFCDQVEANQPSVIDAYGATNESEFFAVVTEAFFEQPAQLAAEYPALYAGLKFFYRQDPASGR